MNMHLAPTADASGADTSGAAASAAGREHARRAGRLRRQAVGRMLIECDGRIPGRLERIARAPTDVRPSQLADRSLFDFAGLGRLRDDPAPDAQAAPPPH